jgi:NosR/NirI family nitrous oxide reductase transcriptional regulator
VTEVGLRELPKLSGDYESNIAGLYIVGDLADAPVIKIALNQGYDTVKKIFENDFKNEVPSPEDGVVDLAILGAGPSGIGASLAAKSCGLSTRIVEREKAFNTIQNYPKNKAVFAEPKDFGKTRFPFMDSIKEDLVEVWNRAIDDESLDIRQPWEVLDIQKQGKFFEVVVAAGEGAEWEGLAAKKGERRSIKARRVVLAIGRRGTVNKIGCAGEDQPNKVHYGLQDPDKHRLEKILVVGGGDSAVEAAVALSQAGATVHISYRKDSFIRAKLLNKQRIEEKINAGEVTALYESTVTEIKADSVLLKGANGPLEIENDRVFVLIGTKLPVPFLQKIGVMMEGAFTWQRLSFMTLFAVITYAFYCIKAYGKIASVADWYWPFGPSHPLGFLHEALQVNLGWRSVDGGFWGTVAYSIMITFFAVLAIRKYRSPIQTKRYLSLIFFQAFFLFSVPELIGPFIIEGGEGWRLYSLSVPWPLWTGALTHLDYSSGTPQPFTPWIIAGAVTTFVAIPLWVRFQGERFCSWLCGCGGLAETLGDQWRHLAPRGRTSVTLEKFGLLIFALAGVSTLLVLGVDVYGFLDAETFGDSNKFAKKWYGIMVDFWFASVVGVGFYPYLGNRVWCRFICPLRAYMELLSKWFGRLKIVANDKCIGCSECTRYCQMGIPVQKFAQMREDLANHNSACIQCGICVEVCPMDVLSVQRSATSTRVEAKKKRSLPIISG